MAENENDATQGIEVETYSAADDENIKSTASAPETTEEPKAEAKSEEPAAESKEQPAEGEAEPDKDDAPKVPGWATKRINEITRQRYESERRAQALEAELAQYRASSQQNAQLEGYQPPQQQQIDPYQLAETLAETKFQQANFDKTCNTIYDEGSKAFPDFDASLQTFGALGGLPPVLVEAAAETGHAHRVLYELGKNPDEAMRIMGLPPARMGAALAKIASKPAAAAAPKPISKAPAPITPVDGAARTADGLSEELDMAEWVRRRTEQVEKRRSSR